jgi:hypothetical protein
MFYFHYGFGIPMVAFFVLLIAGVWLQELEIKHAVIFAILWLVGLQFFGYLGWSRRLFVGVEVLLDCILILKIFGGDIKIR